MKKIFVILLTFISVIMISGCRKTINNKYNTKVGTGYGITHSDNVGYAKVTVKNDVVDSVTFEEAFLPSDWGKVKTTEGMAPDDVLEYGTTTKSWGGKYLVIGNKRFTGTLRNEPLVVNGKTIASQAIKYTSEGINDLFAWLSESEANAKWYFENATTEKSFVATNEWQKHTYESAGRAGRTKTEANYWPGSESALGWKGNLDKLAEALKGTKMNQENQISRDEDNVWKIGDVKTGATLTDLKDYYEIAKRGYNNAK